MITFGGGFFIAVFEVKLVQEDLNPGPIELMVLKEEEDKNRT